MLNIDSKWFFIAIILALFLPTRLIATENDQFLDGMKKANDRVRNIINKHKISYSILADANPFNPKQGFVSKECVASWQGDTLSMTIVYSYENPPTYSPSEQRIDYARDGRLIIWRPVEEYVQFSPTRNEILQRAKEFYAYPDGSIKEANEAIFHLIYPIGKRDSIGEYSHFELATGRDISEKLKNISSIEQDASHAKVKIRAKGSFGKGFEGWWMLLVDANSDYLVREAKFCIDVNSMPIFEAASSGTVSTRDGVAFASKGSLVFDNKIRTSVDNVRIVKMSDKDCTDFHQKISKLLDTVPPGSQMWDFRGGKPVRSTVK